MKIALTYEIAMAAGKDAANASARAAGRTKPSWIEKPAVSGSRFAAKGSRHEGYHS